jgi:hypothetical protein
MQKPLLLMQKLLKKNVSILSESDNFTAMKSLKAKIKLAFFLSEN